jgi:hypothetical protein
MGTGKDKKPAVVPKEEQKPATPINGELKQEATPPNEELRQEAAPQTELLEVKELDTQSIIDGVAAGVKELLVELLAQPTQTAPGEIRKTEVKELVFKPKEKQKPTNKKRK